MLPRRRRPNAAVAAQRQQGVATPAPAARAGAPQAQLQLRQQQQPSKLRSGASLDALLDERMSEYAPYMLPFLINDTDLDEVTSGAMGSSNDITVVEGASRLRIRTSHLLLLMYLHIGSDPPDFPRVEPCARMECWMDPMIAHVAQYAPRGSRGRGSDSIAEALERQYHTFVKADMECMRVVEASVDTTKAALMKVRRMARDNRVVVHYNGHGMPRATDLGEVWMFDHERTHYVPLNILDAAELVDTPVLFVLDCNSAGSVLRRWYHQRMHERRPHDLFICACSANETLPLSPALPADMLTSCLTTPLKMLLEWYIHFSHHKRLLPQVTDEMIRNLPGDFADRKSPRGELTWILGAVTDTIAWCTLPPSQFFYLFRQDAATRTLFRNAILADRLMREAGCRPVTHPPIHPDACLHHMWELLEYTLENILAQLPRLLTHGSMDTYEASNFFDSQLTAFEVWVESGDMSQTPEQLPCVLLALTLIAHRVRAFTLLVKYLDSGRTAGKRSILCGILPYMSKFITQPPEHFLIVIILWMQVIRADPAEGCAELQRTQCEKYITSFLKTDEALTHVEKVEYGQKITGEGVVSGVSSPTAPVGLNGGAGADFVPAGGGSEAAWVSRGAYPSAVPHAGGTTQARLRSSSSSQRFQSPSSLHGPTDHSTSSAAAAGEQEALPEQPMQPTRQPHQRHGAQQRQPQPAPPQPQSYPQLNSIATHAIQPGDTVYFLPKDVDLPRCKSMACYVLCQLQMRGEKQCVACWNNKLLNAAFPCLSSSNEELRSWACLVLSKLLTGLRHAKSFVSRECASRLDLFTRLLRDGSPIVRSSCVTLLASVVGVRVDLLPLDQQLRRLQMEKTLVIKLRGYLFDASMTVREELIFFACQVLYNYRSALPEDFLGKASEYVFEVGRASGDWWLAESDVQVKSLLNAARPTVSTLFNDVVVFDTTVLSADDPLPTTPELDPTQLAPGSLEIVRGLLHDAALILCTLYHNRDGGNVHKALHVLATGTAPQSQRFASEALRTMSRVASTDASYHMSEADRARATWNTDMMKQLVLSVKDRKLEPYQVTALPAQGVRGSNSASTATGDALSIVPGPHSTVARYQVLPSVVRADTVVAAAFRVLEPSAVLVTKDQRIHYVSYDNYNSATRVLKSFTVPIGSLIHDVSVINDLSEQSGLLVVDKRGGFSLFKGCWEPESIPTEAAAFSACPPPPQNSRINLRIAYRTSLATLFYGGPIGESGGTEIHALSLAEEQVTQRLEVSGGATLTCLNTHTVQRVLLAGFSDAVVRYYDDRQKQGQIGALGLLHCKRSDGTGGDTATVLGVGPVARSTGFNIVTATRDTLYVFDARKLTEPVLMRTNEALYHGATQTSSLDSVPHQSQSPAPWITNCSVGVHTGVMGASFSDNTYAAFNSKGQLLHDCPLPVTAVVHAPDQSTCQVLPSSCVAHPLQPMMSFGGDIVFLQI